MNEKTNSRPNRLPSNLEFLGKTSGKSSNIYLFLGSEFDKPKIRRDESIGSLEHFIMSHFTLNSVVFAVRWVKVFGTW